jgi:ParB/RepB/Spo0J family partition protein
MENKPDKLDIVYIPLDKVIETDSNPQEMTASEFNMLVDDIGQNGLDEPLVVAANEDDTYQLIAGHHRKKACRILGYTELPCIVKNIEQEDIRTARMVKSNVLRGKLSPEKFTKIVNDMSARYTHEEMEALFGFADRKAFNQLYKEVRAQLPKEIQEKLDSTRKEIRTIDDLARILNGLFAEYGGTLDQGFMFFTYGGQDHYVVHMTPELKKTMQKLEDQVKASGENMNDALNKVIPAGYKRLNKLDSE